MDGVEGGQSYVERAPVPELAGLVSSVSPRDFLGHAEHTCACGHDHSASFAPLLRARPR